MPYELKLATRQRGLAAIVQRRNTRPRGAPELDREIERLLHRDIGRSSSTCARTSSWLDRPALNVGAHRRRAKSRRAAMGRARGLSVARILRMTGLDMTLPLIDDCLAASGPGADRRRSAGHADQLGEHVDLDRDRHDQGRDRRCDGHEGRRQQLVPVAPAARDQPGGERQEQRRQLEHRVRQQQEQEVDVGKSELGRRRGEDPADEVRLGGQREQRRAGDEDHRVGPAFSCTMREMPLRREAE